MKSVASQSDFAWLDVPYEFEEKGLSTHETVALCLSVSERPADRTNAKFQSEISSDANVPVNVLSDEVLVLIKAWESSCLLKPNHPDNVDLVLAPGCLNDFAPPERFSRTLRKLSTLKSLHDEK